MNKVILILGIVFSITCISAAIFMITFVFSPPCFGMGCTGGYSFQDTAIFTAPNSSLEILIYSTGFVPEGQDLGDGNATVKMYATDTISDTMYLKTSPENIDTITYKGNTIPFSCSQIERDNFYYHLDSIGFEHLDKNEIAELRNAMTIINYGHKAGYVEGQTDYIEVGKHIKNSH